VLLQWLGQLYAAVGEIDPRWDVVPCLDCAGWSQGVCGGLGMGHLGWGVSVCVWGGGRGSLWGGGCCSGRVCDGTGLLCWLAVDPAKQGQ
jgi:hypothetical protein